MADWSQPLSINKSASITEAMLDYFSIFILAYSSDIINEHSLFIHFDSRSSLRTCEILSFSSLVLSNRLFIEGSEFWENLFSRLHSIHIVEPSRMSSELSVWVMQELE